MNNLLAISVLAASLLITGQVSAQDPVPAPNQEVTDDKAKDGHYFNGATEDDKAFIDAVREGLEKSDLNRFQKWRIERRLNKPAFVEMLKSEVRAEVIWNSTDPEAMQNVKLDWSDIDWEAIISVALMLIKLFA